MSCPWIENREKKAEDKSVKYDSLQDYGRRITEVAGKKDKRCASEHAAVCSAKYVEYCKDV